MKALGKRLEVLERQGGVRDRLDPALRLWLGMELSEAERAELTARPVVAPMTQEQQERFDRWWHNPLAGACPRWN